MKYQTFVFCLIIFLLTAFSECFKFSSRGGGSRSSGSSGSRSSGSRSSGSRSSGSSSGGSHSYGGSRSYGGSYSSGGSHSYGGSHSSGGHSSPSYSMKELEPFLKPNLFSFGNYGSKPASSSSGSVTKHTYPSSQSGLSGGNNKFASYPSSSGLSGNGATSKHTYPQSSLSGNGGSHTMTSYPASSGLSGNGAATKPENKQTFWYPSSSGLSGNGGTSKHTYPQSSLSGNGGTNKMTSYPTSSGISGNGAATYWPTAPGFSGNSKNANYPPSTGLSGSHQMTNYNNQPQQVHHHHYVQPTYTAPQAFYVTEYKNSNSRYSDLLTGLTLYNMARSHNHHYYDHYYYDDYYRNRYHSHFMSSPSDDFYGTQYQSPPSHTSSSTYITNNYNTPRNSDSPKDVAQCSLKIKEGKDVQIVRIPCEIVSTFTQGSKTEVSNGYNGQNLPICDVSTNLTVPEAFGNKSIIVNNTQGLNSTIDHLNATNVPPVNNLAVTNTLSSNLTVPDASSVNKTINANNTQGLNSTMDHTNATNVPPVNNLALGNTLSSNLIVPDASSINKTINANNTQGLNSTIPLVDNPTLFNTTTKLSTGNASATAVNIVAATEGVPLAYSLTTNYPVNLTNSVNSSAAPPSNSSSANSTASSLNTTANNTSKIACINPTDPLTVTGPKITGTSMECSVIIKTKEKYISHDMDCKILTEHAKMPEPTIAEMMGIPVTTTTTTTAPLMPSKEKLKTWLEKPPWWLATFIAIL